ncbi:MAG TPA: PqiC family protein [Steroidobacteraceae bacterium]|jgi:hypothetical protein
MRCIVVVLLAGAAAGCVSQHADHFYALGPVPNQPRESRSAFATQVRLTLTIPSLVDRNELVVKSSAGVVVLEHERWASPLADQMITVLGQDIEQRRPDSLVVTRSLLRQNSPTVTVAVQVVSLNIDKNAHVAIETRWRVQRDGADATQGRDSFEVPVAGNEYDAVSRALSGCLAGLADRLVREWPSSG